MHPSRRCCSTTPTVLPAVKYRFIVATEICIDVGQHIISAEGLRAPRDFPDVFASLGESGLLSDEAVSSLGAMARFRNLLVHGYVDVDDRRVIEILQSRLGDLHDLRSGIARQLLTAG